MSSDVQVPTAGNRPRLLLLFEEAERQLNVCNSCRYCEGFCAVFPALERRTVLEHGDISQIANLCHDCRACFDACMYSEPHEFGLNVPKALSAVRVEDYQRYVWPRNVPRWLRGWTGVVSAVVLSSLVVVLVAVLNVGWSGLVVDELGPHSPYDLIPYGQTLILLLVPTLFSVVVMLGAARSYWRETGGGGKRVTLSSLATAVKYAATLRYMTGGGEDCYYPEDEEPSAARRRLHALVMFGFGFCVVSTAAAALMQDVAGIDPPYDLLSVPVLAGSLGGIGMIVGCVGLLLLKARSSEVTSFAEMTVKDYGFLVALEFLALSGMLTLVLRHTDAFGVVYLVHLASVAAAFGSAPYSKFVHMIYRFLAIVRDNLEREEAAAASRD